MATYTDAIQKLYVAYFNRPADFAGLTYWQGVVDAAKGDTTAVSKAFAASDEYKKAYAGMDAYHVLNQVYINLFGHDADLAGLQFWGPKLQAGTITIDSVVTAVAAGAQGTDKVAYDSKVAAATAFTNQLDTAAEILGYSGDVANGMAKTWLSTVKDDATLKAAIADAALASTVNSITHPPVPGQTFALTQGLDTLTGTAGDDVFNAFAFNSVSGADTTTLQSVDTVNGGAGNDTLNIEVKGTYNGTLTGNFSNIETVNIDNTNATAAPAVNASVFAGATSINQITKVNNVTKLAAGTTAGFKGATLDAAAAISVTAASGVSSAAVNLTNVSGDAVSQVVTLGIAGDSLTSATVGGNIVKADPNSGTSASLALNVTNGTDANGKTLASLAVNTAVKTTLTVTNGGTGSVTTVDASASTGAVTYNAGTGVANIKGGAGADTLTLNTAFTATMTTASIDGGAGNDTINVATTGTGSFTANGGDGNDSIVVAQALLTSGNRIDGGAGTDKLYLTNGSTFAAGDYVLLSNTVSNVETLRLKNAATIDASKVAQFSTLEFDAATTVTKAAQAMVSHGDLTATALGFIPGSAAFASDTTYAGNLTVTSDAAANLITLTADTAVVNVNAKTSAAASSTIQGDLATSLTVNVNGGINSSGSTEYASSATVNVSDTQNANLAAVTLKGNGSVVINDSAAPAGTISLKTIDASGLGGVSKATGTAGNILGGLTFTGNVNLAESVTLGSGHDVLTINSTYAKLDTITGFDANHESADGDLTSTNDILNFGGKSFGAGGTAAVVTLTSSESTLDLAFIRAASLSKDATVGATVGKTVYFQFGGNTYLFQDANNNGVLDNSDLAVKLVGMYDLSKDFSLHASPAA